MNKKTPTTKTPWPTKDAMAQVYANNLWGGEAAQFYSGEGSHHPEIVEPYIEVVRSFFGSFETPLVVCDLGCGDFNVGKQLVDFTKIYEAVDIVPALIRHNKETFKNEKLQFHCLNISEGILPKADCVILRQVLQHLSNAEILNILKRIKKYKYLILTEHIPKGIFTPNKDIISGQGTRLKKKSGIDLLAAPFNLKATNILDLLTIEVADEKGIIVTTIYTLF